MHVLEYKPICRDKVYEYLEEDAVLVAVTRALKNEESRTNTSRGTAGKTRLRLAGTERNQWDLNRLTVSWGRRRRSHPIPELTLRQGELLLYFHLQISVFLVPWRPFRRFSSDFFEIPAWYPRPELLQGQLSRG